MCKLPCLAVLAVGSKNGSTKLSTVGGPVANTVYMLSAGDAPVANVWLLFMFIGHQFLDKKLSLLLGEGTVDMIETWAGLRLDMGFAVQ
jgi:hypothetical protein